MTWAIFGCKIFGGFSFPFTFEKAYDLRSHIENRKILPVSIWVEAIWSHKKMHQSYENKKNFSKIASHKKGVKPYAFLLVFIWLHMTWDQRYCLRSVFSIFGIRVADVLYWRLTRKYVFILYKYTCIPISSISIYAIYNIHVRFTSEPPPHP